jgi:hypothetical protein
VCGDLLVGSGVDGGDEDKVIGLMGFIHIKEIEGQNPW